MFIDLGLGFSYSSMFWSNVFLLIVREGEGEGDRDITDEKDGSTVFCTPRTGDRARIPGLRPDRESQGVLLVHGTMLNRRSLASWAYSSILVTGSLTTWLTHNQLLLLRKDLGTLRACFWPAACSDVVHPSYSVIILLFKKSSREGIVFIDL